MSKQSCTSCGGTDHQRKNSKKCRNYAGESKAVLKVKVEKEISLQKSSFYTVVCGLAKFVNPDAAVILKLIESDVVAVSKTVFEFSIYCNYYFVVKVMKIQFISRRSEILQSECCFIKSKEKRISHAVMLFMLITLTFVVLLSIQFSLLVIVASFIRSKSNSSKRALRTTLRLTCSNDWLHISLKSQQDQVNLHSLSSSLKFM